MRDDALAAAIEADWRSAELDERRRAMLNYAVKLTQTPARCTRADIEALRSVGFADGDILELCEVVAYYAFVNRIADGLGVELE